MATALSTNNRPGPGQMEMWNLLVTNSERVKIYEDPELQRLARNSLPLVELTKSAMRNDQKNKEMLAAATDQEKNNAKPMDVRDFLLLETMKWFKEKFFTWTDAPLCSACETPTSRAGSLTPGRDDLKWGANRVEGYRCPACGRQERFPRYNHPGRLLETRTGRCGEWANCFTLVCRSISYEARYVYDLTDHVWTEVYSESQGRWLHCDPCENCLDKPLLYEHGWGKRLSYVFAFSKDEVVDVSWRYTSRHAETLTRRTKCDERTLSRFIAAINKRVQGRFDVDRVKSLQTRLVREMVEFLSTREAGEGERTGRVSGSLDWRRSRMEAGSNSGTGASIRLTGPETAGKKLHLGYSAARDEYVRFSDNRAVLKGWPTLANRAKNIFRKEERDWLMTYLARNESNDRSSVTWVFDFRNSGLHIDNIRMKFSTATYENGAIKIELSSEARGARRLRGDNEFEYFTDFQGEDNLTLSVEMCGGEGSVAWQHTQLFRQRIDATELPFEVIINFK